MATVGNIKKGISDTKEFRIAVLKKANERLGLIKQGLEFGNGTIVNRNSGMLSLLDSTYQSDVPSTIYAMHLKAIAFESARFLYTSESVLDDLIFETTRGEYLSQNIGSFLFPNNSRFAQTSYTDLQVRNFYLSIIKAYFGGCTLQNIETSLYKFLSLPIQVVENFLTTRKTGMDDVPNKFTFNVVINVDDPRIKNLAQLQNDITFLLNIIKPAHTYYSTKFIFSELFDVFKKGCAPVVDGNGNPVVTHDGFDMKMKLANTAICDTMHIDTYSYYYEDLRKPVNLVKAFYVSGETLQNKSAGIFQASPRVGQGLQGGLWSSSDPRVFHTTYGPLGTSVGDLATTVYDVQVYIDGVPATITEIDALTGSFKLLELPSDESIVTANYYFLKDYSGPFYTNDFGSALNNYANQSKQFNYKTVLFPAERSSSEQKPYLSYHKYKGFDLFYSSVLNDARSLNLNEQGMRNSLNDYVVFKSLGYDSESPDLDSPSAKNSFNVFYEGVTPVPVSLNDQEVWRRLPYQEFRMSTNEFIMNNIEDRLFGEIHFSSYHPFYAALVENIVDNGGTKHIVQSIFEDPANSLFINFQRLFEESYPKVGGDSLHTLHVYPEILGPCSATGYSSTDSNPKFTVLNDAHCVLGGGAVWDISSSGNSTAHFGNNFGQIHMLLQDVKEEEYSSLSINDGNFPVAINSFENEFYKCAYALSTYPNELDWQGNPVTPIYPTVLNSPDAKIMGNKATEEPVVVEYVNTDSSNLAFVMDPYIPAISFLSMGLSMSQIASLNNTNDGYPGSQSPDVLKFVTPRKILTNSVIPGNNQGVVSITNSRQVFVQANSSSNKFTGSSTLQFQQYQNGDIVTFANAGGGVIPNNPYYIINIDPVFSTFQISLTPSGSPVSLNSNSTNIASVNQNYDMTGMAVINDRVLILDGTLPTNSNIGLIAGDIILSEYEAVDLMNEYDQLVSVYSSPKSFNYPYHFSFQLFTRVKVSSVLKITNYTQGYSYDLTNLVILDNRTVFIFKGTNVGKTLNPGDIVFAYFVTVDLADNPAPTLTTTQANYLTTQINIHPV